MPPSAACLPLTSPRFRPGPAPVFLVGRVEPALGGGEDTDTAKANFDAVLSAVTRIPGALDRLAGRDSSDAGQ
jgi:hypothetical protein